MTDNKKKKPLWNKRRRRPRANKSGQFKSGLEKDFALLLMSLGKGVQYEPDRLPFIKQSHYVPDFKIAEKVYIETKGFFPPSKRKDLIAFTEQYPHLKIYLVFDDRKGGGSKCKLYPGAKTTYGDWCDKHGFQYSNITQGIPNDWFTGDS